jgi:hypothetical protein
MTNIDDDDDQPDRYQQRKDAERERNKRRSHDGRNIGSPPPVKDPARRQRGQESGEAFLLEYFPDTFTLPFSDSHRDVIKLADEIVRHGGMQATAMPRGSGKTSIFERLTLRSILYGFRKFCVILGSNQEAADEILETLKTEIMTNERLADDFPEVCHPFLALEEIANRAKGQHIEGEPTGVLWSRSKLVFPTVSGSLCGGSILVSKGILSRLRGMKHKSRTGEELRPDFVMPDDPQTDNSAKSAYQVSKRLKVLRGTVLGLAGPGKSIAAFCPCTVIEPDDLAAQLLDRETAPEWHGQKIPLMRSMPSNRDLWVQYWDIRADAMRHDRPTDAATEFYQANRTAMDAGADPTWMERFNHDEISAIQNAMNVIQQRGQEAFDAEMQQKPRGSASTDISLWFLDPKDLQKKIWTPAPNEQAPALATTAVSFIDVQQQLLYFAVGLFGDRFRGVIPIYGTWPKQPNPFFRYSNARIKFEQHYPGYGIDESIKLALTDLIEYLKTLTFRTSQGELRITKIGIDTGFKKEAAHEQAKLHPGLILPCKGVPIEAGNRPFGEYSVEAGAINGYYWRETPHKLSPRLLHVDSNFWKTKVHVHLANKNTDRDSLRLPHDSADDNEQLIDHLRSENPNETFGHGRRVVVWKHPVSKPDNHWFDCCANLMALASRMGIISSNAINAAPKLTQADIEAYNQRIRNRRFGR